MNPGRFLRISAFCQTVLRPRSDGPDRPRRTPLLRAGIRGQAVGMRRNGGLRTVTAMATMGIVLVAGCGPASTGSVAPSASPRTLALNGQRLTACGLGNFGTVAFCGTLRVPENRDKPAGRQIDLRVAVVPAIDARPQSDPVFFLAGGPGGAATESWATAGSIFPAVHQHRDIVLVDQRGTGASHAVEFPPPPDVGGLSAAEAKARIDAYAKSALASLDADPSMYTTATAMDDLDQVRQALGYQRINLYGGSYGATAAQYYLRQHGSHVRTVVLDGGTLLDVPIFELIAPNSQAALNRVLDRCMAAFSCASAYPQVRQQLANDMRELAARPVTVDLNLIGQDGTLVVDADTFASAIHSLLLSQQGAASIPLVIQRAAVGDLRPVARLVTQNPDTTGRLVMSVMIRCFEGWAKFDLAATRTLGAGSYMLGPEEKGAESEATACPLLPVPNLSADDALAVKSSVPVLLLNGSADPQDPPSNVTDARRDFPNSLTVVAPDQGHTVGHLGCLPGVVAAFIAAGNVWHLSTSCVRSMSPPPFTLPE